MMILIPDSYIYLFIRLFRMFEAIVLKRGLHGQTVRRTWFDRQVFEVMFECVNGVKGCRTRLSNGSRKVCSSLTFVGGTSLSTNRVNV